MTRSLSYAAFAIGLAVVCWIGAGYVGSNPLALAMTLLIAACYLAGAIELRRFDQATATLARAVADTSPPSGLGAWLEALHPSLRNAVRLRIEGERVGLPGPALTPYLAGLLVLLGMLGTFIGMVVTLKGTGLALESASDLQAIRASLAAPVKGLGLAFGTSVAGVAASAMLGLVSALCRRERQQAVQGLDTRIATSLRMFSRAQRRDESFQLLQRQGEVLPALVDRLQEMMAAMTQQSLALNERLLAGQDGFHRQAEAAYAGLASTVGLSLKESLTESARAAGATIRPVVEAAMAGIARESSALNATVEQGVQRQLDGLSTRLEASTATVAAIWHDALASQQRTSEAQSQDLRAALDQFTQTFEQRSAALVDGVSARLDHTLEGVSNRLEQTFDGVSSRLEYTFDGASTGLAQTVEGVSTQLAQTVDGMSTRLAQTVEGMSTRLDASVADISGHWRDALAQQQRSGEALSTDTRQALEAAAATFAQHAAALLSTVDAAHAHQQAETAARDAQRLTDWNAALQAMAASLHDGWQQSGARAEAQQQDICDTLAQTAREISAQTEAHAKNTLAEIGQLMQAAAEAPRVAAEVIGELRQKLSDSMLRDNAMLDERSRILGTLETLLGAINHAATEQRAAIDALVGTSAELLDRVGASFSDRVEAGTGRLGEVAAQVTGSAVEVASMGEAFGVAVQQFSQSNDRLGAQLERIEGALGRSLARSDEQLAYYVAQAREVVDLSILSQKQIVEDLQQIASQQRAAAGADA